MVLLLNGFGFASFILIDSWFLLANGACTGITTASVIYTGMEKNYMDSPAR